MQTIICLYRNVPVPLEAKDWSYEYQELDTAGLPSIYVKQPYIRSARDHKLLCGG